MRLFDRLTGRDEARSVSGLSLNDMLDVFTRPDTNVMATSWGNINNEELVGTNAEAFLQNGPIFALIQARMQLFSQARFQWTRWTSGTPNDLFGSKDLSILEFPSPGQTTSDLLSRMEVDASLAGNAFIRRVPGTNGAPDRLVRLRPEWCTIVLGSKTLSDAPWLAADVEEIGVIYRPEGGPEGMELFSTLPGVNSDVAEVAHYAPVPDPYQHYRGMSWLTPVLRDVMADDATELHKLNYFKNAATPNYAIKFDPMVTVDQIKQFREVFEQNNKGVLNAYKTLYLGGGADPVPLGANMQQMAFAETQGKGESRLAAAAGVPPSWVGFSEGLQGSALNAGNFTAARRRLADGTLHHLWAAAARSLEPIVQRPPNRSNQSPPQLWYDVRSIPFLRDDAQDHAATQMSNASTMRTLIDAGFEPATVERAVAESDWSLLVHSGLYSVQLQPPQPGQVVDGVATPTQPTPTGGQPDGGNEATAS